MGRRHPDGSYDMRSSLSPHTSVMTAISTLSLNPQMTHITQSHGVRPREEGPIMTGTLKPIETHYRGYRFRSRLEARWAVFFDKLRVRWDYEPQGYALTLLPRDPDHLGAYLPDFWLPDQQSWFEVKGEEPDAHEWQRLSRFADLVIADDTAPRLFVAVGRIPDPTTVGSSGPYGDQLTITRIFPDDASDEPYAWTTCTNCGFPDLQWSARSERNHCGCGAKWEGDNYQNGDDHLILAAYQAARSARFEHGEQP